MSEKHSLGSMVSDLSADLSSLVRGQIELAKTELKDSARNAASGGGLLAAALVLAGTGALFLLLTLAWLLDEWLPTWAAFGIVTLLLLVVAVVLALVGRTKLETMKGLPVTTASIEKTKAALARKPGAPVEEPAAAPTSPDAA